MIRLAATSKSLSRPRSSMWSFHPGCLPKAARRARGPAGAGLGMRREAIFFRNNAVSWGLRRRTGRSSGGPGVPCGPLLAFGDGALELHADPVVDGPSARGIANGDRGLDQRVGRVGLLHD